MSTNIQNLMQESALKRIANRDGFGEALVELGNTDPSVVVLSADLTESTRAEAFAKKFPDRFFEMGVAEQNMMGVAAGLALSGKTPFVCSYAVFSPGRSWDQLRVSVCYSRANVKIMGGHTGLSVGPDGATHQAMEDLAITRCLPNLVVLCPSDAVEAKKATLAAAKIKGPVYLRFAREALPVFNSPDTPFRIGKIQTLREGNDVTIIACGTLVYESLLAAEHLATQGISAEVINNASIKPLDVAGIVAAVQKTHAVVTVEEHQILGGLGSAVAEVLSRFCPTPMEMIGMRDQFGESGKTQELWEKYGLTASYIEMAVKKVLRRKTLDL